MINFETELDRSTTGKLVTQVPTVVDTVTTRRPTASRTHLTSRSSTWDWQQLRDYVVGRIEAIHGPFPRDAVKEASIFKGFLTRWGAQAGPIAEFAFEQVNGMWKGSPVGITRFCKNSDAFFAAEIARDRLS